jgi:hypothetical protein
MLSPKAEDRQMEHAQTLSVLAFSFIVLVVATSSGNL